MQLQMLTVTVTLISQGMHGKALLNLTSILDGNEWSASHSRLLDPQEITLSAPCIGSQVGPTAGLDVSEKTYQILHTLMRIGLTE